MGELILVLLIVLLIFGASRLPGLGAGLGKAIRGFKDAVRDDPKPAGPAAQPPAGTLPPASEAQERDVNGL